MSFLVFLLAIILLVAVAVALCFRGRCYLGWVVPGVLVLGVWALRDPTWWLWTVVAFPFGLAALMFGVPALRRSLVSRRVMKIMKGVLPTISETERIALEAGTVWWDAEFFSGSPDWDRILGFTPRGLSPQEQRFLDGPVEELCRRIDDWDARQDNDLPPEIWEFIKENKFFGMIIPEEYGGLGFSALAHSSVVTKVSSRSVAASVTVMVPNSLGPAELLLHYGTEDQKKHYLPRLARGEEIPCFALTEPRAGSDAGSISSSGVVCRGEWEGEDVLGIRLNWDKRYITLGPVATVLGLAFQLRDPDHLLGEKEELGITCALIPTDLSGIEIGTRHDPLGVPFMNGPNSGRDVFVPVDHIIGGAEQAGQGWMMLMQCLAAGRSISLPSLSTGAAQLTTRVISAYANVREQFNINIGLFEGVAERVARIAGHTYVMNAARVLTASSVDAGEKPAVVSAIVKAYMTDMMRTVVNDGMDVQAGAAICEGPRNILASPYASVPIGITVEGANILTRSMIIYGQGALRCHPYVRKQVEAVEAGDLATFDQALFSHVGFTTRNAARAFVYGLTGSALAPAGVPGAAEPYFRALTRASAGFATLSDAAMAVLGGSLKRKEMISGRLADALAWMYLGACTLKTFVDRDQPDDEKPLLEWSLEHALYSIQEAFLGVLDNLPSRPMAWGLGIVLFPPGSRRRPPSDRQVARVARAVLESPSLRDRLTQDIFIPPDGELGLGVLEEAYRKVLAAAPILAKVKAAVKDGRLQKARGDALLEEALARNVITEAEIQTVRDANSARDEAIAVDAFEPETSNEPIYP